MEPLLDIADVAALLGVTPRTIRRWVQDKTFPCGIRIGRRSVRWPENTISKWIAEQPAAKPSENQREAKRDTVK